MSRRKKIIIALNLYFMVLAGYFLVGEYIRLQTPHEPEPICADLGLLTGMLVILALVTVSGTFAILLQLSAGRPYFRQGFVKHLFRYLIEPVTILHATVCGLLGIAGLISGTVSILKYAGNFQRMINEVDLLLHFAGFAVLGILTIYKIRKNQLPVYDTAEELPAESIPDKRLM